MPVDPYEEPTGHRPLDYWGRSLIDHFVGLLPKVLTPDGVAYLMQVSIIGQAQTDALLAEQGPWPAWRDYSFFPFDELFVQNREQILRVERLSDAYHLQGRRRGRDGRVPPRDQEGVSGAWRTTRSRSSAEGMPGSRPPSSRRGMAAAPSSSTRSEWAERS